MITVILSTFNGEHTLPKMLEAMKELEEPVGSWELIIVNNNSTDSTDDILKQNSQALPIRIFQETRKGKNYALNSVLQYINGDIVVFTDDDVIPAKNWLVRIRNVVDKEPEYTVFGGKIEVFWPHPPNPWNDQWINKGIVYGITPEDQAAGNTGAGNIWGANMVIRADIFQKGYIFDVAIGPDGTNNYLMGSETSLTRKLESDGYHCWYEPTWVVKHIIKPSQMERKWVLLRAMRFGKGIASKMLTNPENEKPRMIYGVPRYLLNLILRKYFKLFVTLFSLNTEKIFRTQWEILYLKGLISQLSNTKKDR